MEKVHKGMKKKKKTGGTGRNWKELKGRVWETGTRNPSFLSFYLFDDDEQKLGKLSIRALVSRNVILYAGGLFQRESILLL